MEGKISKSIESPEEKIKRIKHEVEDLKKELDIYKENVYYLNFLWKIIDIFYKGKIVRTKYWRRFSLCSKSLGVNEGLYNIAKKTRRTFEN